VIVYCKLSKYDLFCQKFRYGEIISELSKRLLVCLNTSTNGTVAFTFAITVYEKIVLDSNLYDPRLHKVLYSILIPLRNPFDILNKLRSAVLVSSCGFVKRGKLPRILAFIAQFILHFTHNYYYNDAEMAKMG
jgi:hypothetical protein